MKSNYYIISADHARLLGVTDFRYGSEQDGYIVNGGDLAVATQDVWNEALPVSEHEAEQFVQRIKNK